jgi:hypothetical protein
MKGFWRTAIWHADGKRLRQGLVDQTAESGPEMEPDQPLGVRGSAP